jgi:hypothetical protein
MSGVFSRSQQIALAICPRFTAALSLASSCLVASLTLRKQRRKGAGQDSIRNKKAVYKGLVLGMSCADILSSAAWFCGTWLIPSEPGSRDEFLYLGSQASCTIQGFFGNLCIISVLYNSCLALYYFLVIGKGCCASNLMPWQKYMHGVALSYGIVTSTVAASLQMFNSVGWTCWIAAYPPGCIESWRAPLLGQPATCTRGDNATLFLWGGFYGPLWIAILFTSITMGQVYKSVQKTETKSSKYDRSWSATSGNIQSIHNIKKSRNGMDEGNDKNSEEPGSDQNSEEPVVSKSWHGENRQRRKSLSGMGTQQNHNDMLSFSTSLHGKGKLMKIQHVNGLSLDTRSLTDDDRLEVAATTSTRQSTKDSAPPLNSTNLTSIQVDHDGSFATYAPGARVRASASSLSTFIYNEIGNAVENIVTNSPQHKGLSATADFPFAANGVRRHKSWGGRSLHSHQGDGEPRRKSQNSVLDNEKDKRGMKKRASDFLTGLPSWDATTIAPSVTSTSTGRRKSSKVASQAMLYSGALFLTWTFPTLYNMVYSITRRPVFALILLESIFLPTLGLWNLILYMRPSYTRYRKKFSALSKLQLMKMLCTGQDEKIIKQENKIQLKAQRKNEHKKKLREHKITQENLQSQRPDKIGTSTVQTKQKGEHHQIVAVSPDEPTQPVAGKRIFKKPSGQILLLLRKRINQSQSSDRSRTSFDPSCFDQSSGHCSSETPSFALDNGNGTQMSQRKQRLIKKWQSNYNHYPGRHPIGDKPIDSEQHYLTPEPLDRDEEELLWLPHAEEQGPTRSIPAKGRHLRGGVELAIEMKGTLRILESHDSDRVPNDTAAPYGDVESRSMSSSASYHQEDAPTTSFRMPSVPVPRGDEHV